MQVARYLHLIIWVSVLFLFWGCTGKREGLSKDIVVVAIEGDIDSFNPLFAEDIIAGEINDLFYPGLLGSEFDTATGLLIDTPLLATSWAFENGNRDVVFYLRTDARWFDGVPVSAKDIRFSYELYADPEVASIRQMAVENLRLTGGKLDVSKSVVVRNDSVVVFHFQRPVGGDLSDAALPIIPSHVFQDIPRRELRTHPINRTPVPSGPFVLTKWAPFQDIMLSRNDNSRLPGPARLAKLVLRILPDHRTRVTQLQTGEVDVVMNLRREDVEILSKAPSVRITSTPGRDYDFLGWNNIDPEKYRLTKGEVVRPHRLFGSPAVRRALTMAINRGEIVQAYLGSTGLESFGPISPLFKQAYNDTMRPLPFDADQAKRLLESEGWRDTDGDGVLDRHGERFSFTLKVPGGNQLRSVIATVVQQQLRNIKVEMKIEHVERSTFWNDMMERKYDAWFAGFSVSLHMQLEEFWGSDLKKYPFNLVGFQNRRVDEILAATRKLQSHGEMAALWKEFQLIIQDMQPCTFLFWINNVVGSNTRVQGTHFGVLGTMHRAWEWNVSTGEASASM